MSLRELREDLLFVAGLAFIGWGIYDMHGPGWKLFVGVVLLVAGIALAYSRIRKGNRT